MAYNRAHEEDGSNFTFRKITSHLVNKHVLANILPIPSSYLNRKIIIQNPQRQLCLRQLQKQISDKRDHFSEEIAPLLHLLRSVASHSLILQWNCQALIPYTHSSSCREGPPPRCNLRSPDRLLFLMSEFLQAARIPKSNRVLSFHHSGLCFVGVHGALPQAEA